MVRVGKSIDKVISYIVRNLSYVGVIVLASMMMLTVIDVFMRFALNLPILGSSEIIEFMMLTLAFLVISYTTLERGHVRVDLVISRFSSRTRVILDIFSYIFCLALYIPMTWRYIPETMENWRMGETSVVLEITAIPFYFVVIVGCGLLCLVLLVHLVKRFAEVTKI